jgi:hypothetical protein
LYIRTLDTTKGAGLLFIWIVGVWRYLLSDKLTVSVPFLCLNMPPEKNTGGKKMITTSPPTPLKGRAVKF